MNLPAMLSDLRTQRDMLNEAIASVERLIAGGGKRRGRPPLWMGGNAPGKKFSAETRKRMSEAQKARWAKR